MKFNKLGNTDLQVSKICLGTMTYGEQNSEAEAHEQMDYAVSQGVNFFDTADIYGLGKSEELIGKGLMGQRDKAIIATKFGVKYDENNAKVISSTIIGDLFHLLKTKNF